jgi:hypothetical protein
MLHPIFKSATFKVCMLAVFCSTLFSYIAKAGGDSYEIYLNSTLMFKQARLGTLSSSISLSKANYNDQLVITYSHCGRTGTGRSIVLKDDHNNILREWKFADANGADVSMSIPVKEILELQKKNSNATLNLFYYSSQYLPEGRMLTSIKLPDGNTVLR